MSTMTTHTIGRQYDLLCSIYDTVFTNLLNPGRKEVMRAVNASPARSVLEVGVGTGVCLDQYRSDMRITGIDISAKMIGKARQRVERLGLRHVRLMEMDAEDMPFPDHSFDAVVALYVVSTVSKPERMMAELNRVCKPGGRIFILNHFSERMSPMRWIEKIALPLTSRIGWRSYFERSQIALPSMRLLNVKRLNCFGYWQLLEFENNGNAV